MSCVPDEAITIIQAYEGLGGHRDGLYFLYHGEADAKDVFTIGRGRVLTHVELVTGYISIFGQRTPFKNGLTLEQVDRLFTEDISPRLQRTRLYMPGANGHELAAGLSLYYNCETALSRGSPGRYFRSGETEKSAAAFLLYVRSPSGPQLGLWRRRMTEALCLLTGEVIIAKEPQMEAILFEKLTALGTMAIAAELAGEQRLRIPWLKV